MRNALASAANVRFGHFPLGFGYCAGFIEHLILLKCCVFPFVPAACARRSRHGLLIYSITFLFGTTQIYGCVVRAQISFCLYQQINDHVRHIVRMDDVLYDFGSFGYRKFNLNSWIIVNLLYDRALRADLVRILPDHNTINGYHILCRILWTGCQACGKNNCEHKFVKCLSRRCDRKRSRR